MRVVCLRLRDGRDNLGDVDSWLTVGSEYDVLEVLTNINATDAAQRAFFRIPTLPGASPGLWSTTLFGMVDGAVPPSWAVRIDREGDLKFSHPGLQEDGFWDRLDDGDPDAEQVMTAALAEVSGR